MVSQSGVIDIGISDHQMIYCTRKKTREINNENKEIKYRCLRNYSPEDFLLKLRDLNFPQYQTFENSDEAYADFIEKVSSVINELAPEKTRRIKNNSEEWVDADIHDGIRERNKKFKRFKQTRSHRSCEL